MNPALRLDHRDHELEDHDRGLVYDLVHARPPADAQAARLRRDQRRACSSIAGCAPAGSSRDPRIGGRLRRAGAPARPAAPRGVCEVIPEETAGPFPGDGSNGPDVLTQSGVVREDIRSSFGSSTTVAEGVPLDDQAHRPGRRATARRSPARPSTSGTATGTATTRSTRRPPPTRTTCAASRRPTTTASSRSRASSRPCYSGRWPHIHFEVYPSLETATDEANKIATSQIALPKDACDTRLRDRRLRARASATWPRLSLADRQRLRRRRRRPPARHGHRRRGRAG